jgi:LysM repeat protein
VDHVCPLLALAGDRHAAVDGVDDGHRCHAEDPPAPLDRAMQAQLCLTTGYDRCERYLAFVARSGSGVPGRSSAGDGFVSTRLLLAPQPAWRGIAGRTRGSRPAIVIGSVVGLAVIGITGATVAGALLDGDPTPTPAVSQAAVATPSPTTRPTATVRPTATPTPTIEPTAVPTAAPTAVPTPVPTVVPTPPPQQTYTVVAGDTLADIAQRFGTSVAALQEANGIEDPDEITVGQVLVIP